MGSPTPWLLPWLITETSLLAETLRDDPSPAHQGRLLRIKVGCCLLRWLTISVTTLRSLRTSGLLTSCCIALSR
jgi:hypothetical protein